MQIRWPAIKRYTIRAAAIVMALLTLASANYWLRSHRSGDFALWGDAPRLVEIYSVDGLFRISWGTITGSNYPPPPGWRGTFLQPTRGPGQISVDLRKDTLWGFHYEHWQMYRPAFRGDARMVTFPYWALTGILALLTGYVGWRIVQQLKNNLIPNRFDVITTPGITKEENSIAPKTIDEPHPKIFLRGTFRYRSQKLLASTILVTGPIFFAWLILYSPFVQQSTPVEFIGFPLLVGGLALICAIGTLQWAYGILTNRTRNLIITEQGIQYGNNRWHWNQIRQIGALHHGCGHVTLKIQFNRKKGWLGRTLPTTPSTTTEEFHKLVEQLQRHLIRTHPQIKIATSPQNAAS